MDAKLIQKIKALIGFGAQKSSENSEQALSANTSNKKQHTFGMPLEPRIMLDAAMVATDGDVQDNAEAQSDNIQEQGASEEQLLDSFASLAAGPAREVVLVDPSVADYQTLLEGLPDNIDVHILSENASLAEISDVLSGYNNLDAVHLISHGDTGSLSLGGETITESTLQSQSQILAAIGQSLNEDGDILLYGCNVGGDEAGQSFIDLFAELTSADVAASDDLTGVSGDWELEVEEGAVEASVVIAQSAQDAYNFNLVPPGLGVSSFSDIIYDASGGAPGFIAIGTNIVLTDSDNDWDGGSLEVEYVDENSNVIDGEPGDNLRIATGGDDDITIDESGSVAINGISVGIVSPATGQLFDDGSLKIDFNANALTIHVQIIIDAIEYSNDLSPPPSLLQKAVSFSVTDQAGGTDSVNNNILISLNAPVFSGDDSGSIVVDASPNTVMGSLTITDADDDQGSLIQQNDATGVYGTFSIDANNNWTYTLDNANADVQNLQGASTLTDTFTVTSVDGSTHDVVITIHDANDAPTFTEGVTLAPVAEDTTEPAGASISDLFTGVFSDLDNDVLAGIVIAGNTADAGTQGEWQYTANNGTDWHAVGTVSAESALVLGSRSMIDKLRFVPLANYNGSVPSLEVYARDDSAAFVITTNNNRVFYNTTVDSETSSVSATGVALSTSVSTINDVPVLGNNTLTVNEGQTVPISAANFSATDVENDDTALTFTVSNVQNGSFQLVSDSSIVTSFTQAQITGGEIKFVHDGGEDAPSYDVRVGDGDDVSSAVSGNVTFSADVNDAPTAADNTITIVEDGSHPFAASDFGFSDVDANDELVSITISTLPDAGTLELGGSAVTRNQVIAVADIPTLVFTPAANANGDGYASFQFTVHDGDTDSLSTNTITVDVSGVNDAPTVTGPLMSDANEGDASYTQNLLSDASDAEGQDLSITGVTYTVDSGSATSTAPDGVSLSGSILTIDPGHSTFDDLALAEIRQIVVSYTVSDGNGGTVTQSFTLTITGTNDLPVVSADSQSTTQGLTISRNVPVPTDVDGTIAANGYALVNNVGEGNGTLLFNSDGSYTFNPGSDFDALAADVTRNVTFTYTATDNNAAVSSPATITITVTGTNDAPTISIDDATMAGPDEDTGAPSGAVGFVVSDVLSTEADVDGNSVGMAVTGLSQGTLYYNADGTGNSWIQYAGVTLSDGNALLLESTARIYFRPSADVSGTVDNAITFRGWDGTSGNNGDTGVNALTNGGTTAFSANSDTLDLTIDNVNDAPVLGNLGDTLDYDENDPAEVIDSNVTLSDIDDDNIERAIIEIIGNFVSTEDLLSIDSVDVIPNTVTVTYSAGTLTLSGTATKAEYQAMLQKVRYSNSSERPDTGTRTISWSVNDGDDTSAIGTSSITVTSVNDVPSFTLPANPTQLALEDEGAQIVTGFASNISKGAAEESGQSLTFNVTTNNSAAFASGPAIDAGTGDLTYTLADNWNGGPITVTVNLSDDGGTDDNGVDTSVDQTFTISATPVPDDPILSVSGSPGYTENNANTPIVLDSTATLNDADGDSAWNNGRLEVRISANHDNTDQLSINTSGSLDISGTRLIHGSTVIGTLNVAGGVVSGNSFLVITFNSAATNAFVQDVLRAISFSNTSDNPSTTARTVSFNAVDGGGASDTGSLTVSVSGVNDAPTVTGPLTSGANEGANSYTSDLLSGASDIEGNNLSINAVTYSVDGGSSSSTAPAGVSISGSTLSVDPTDAAFDYLAAGATRIIVVSYTIADDGSPSGSVSQTHTITITGTNDDPVVSSVLTSGADEGDASYTQNLLSGASDAEGQSLSITGVTYTVGSGSATSAAPDGVSLSGSTLTIDPGHSTFDDLALAETRQIVVSYTVSDGNGGTVAQSFTLTITGTNDLPVVSADSQSTTQGLTISRNVPVPTDVDGTIAANGYALVNNVGVGNGTLSFSNDGSYTFNPGSDFDALAAGVTRNVTFTYTATDNNAAVSSPATITITVTGTNDAPTISIDDATMAGPDEDTGAPSGAVGFVVSDVLSTEADVDGNSVGMAVTGLSQGTLYYNADGTGNSWIQYAGVTLSDGNALLLESTARIYFRPSADVSGTVDNAITFRGWDGTSGNNGDTGVNALTNGGTTAFSANSDTLDLTIANVNDAPVLGNLGDTLDYDENDPAEVIDSNVTLSDIDDDNIERAIIEIIGNFVSTEDLLSIDSADVIPNTVTVTYSAGTLTLSGTATKAEYQAMLQKVRYSNSSERPDTGTRTISWSVNDGDDTSAIGTSSITVTSVNDVPSFTLPANPTQLALEDDGAQIVTGFASNISKGAAEESGQSLTFNVTTNNSAAFASGPAIDAGTGDLTYTLADNWNGGPITVTVNLSDDGGTDDNGVDTSVDQTFTISATPVPDDPILSVSGSPGYTENNANTPIVLDSTATLNDADGDSAWNNGRLEVRISANHDNTDQLSINTSGSLDISGTSLIHGSTVIGTLNVAGGVVSGNSFLVITFNSAATNAFVQDVLRAISFSNTSDNPSTTARTVSFNAVDGGGASDTGSLTVSVSGVNDAPTVTGPLTSGANEGANSYTSDLLSGASDIEGNNLSINAVTYSVDGGSSSSTAPAGVSISGSTLSVDPTDAAFDYLAAGATRIIVVSYTIADDGSPSGSVSQTHTITITGTNDDPVVSSVLTSGADEGDASYTQNLLSGASDAEGQSLSITGVTYTVDSGSATSTAPDGVSLSGSILTIDPGHSTFDDLALAEIRQIVVSYTVSDGNGGTVTQSFTLTITGTNDLPVVSADSQSTTQGLTISRNVPVPTDVDGTIAANGYALVNNVGVGNGTLSFSNDGSYTFNPGSDFDALAAGVTRNVTFTYTATDNNAAVSSPATITITVTGTNDAPTISIDDATMAGPDEDTGAPSGAVGFVVSDVLSTEADVDGNSVGMAVTGLSQGTLYYNADGTGNSWIQYAGVTLSDGNALLLESTARIYFRPSADVSGTVDNAITFRGWDGTSGNNGDTGVNALTNGGTTAFSANSDTLDLTIANVNDAPVLGNLGDTLDYDENDPAEVIDSNVTLSDIDDDNIESAIIEIIGNFVSTEDLLSIDSADVIPNTVTVTYSAGTLTLSGTATKAEYQAMLQKVRYSNSSERPDTGTRTISWSVNDGDDTSAIGTSSITVTAVNDAPTMVVANTTLVYTENDAATPVDGAATLTDVDDLVGTSEWNGGTLTAQISDGAQVTDELSIVGGNLSFSGTDLYHGSTVIGSVGEPNGLVTGESFLSVTFNGNATNAMVQDVLQAISFRSTSENPVDSDRTVTLTVTDSTGGASGTTTASRVIDVNPVNDVPSFTLPANPNQAALEDAGAQTVTGFASNISKGAAEESGQSLTFNVTTNNSAAFASGPAIDTGTGDLTYTLADNWNGGPITVTVTLSDDGGTANGGDDESDAQTFTISGTSVNDVPSFTVGADQTVLEDVGGQTVLGFASNISRGLSNADATDDESGQTLTFNVTTDNNAAFAVGPAIDTATGDLTYTLAANWNGGPITVTVNLSDNGGIDDGGVNVSADQTFTISGTTVNDVPSFTVGADQTVLEDAGAQTVSGFASNISRGLSNPDAADDESGQTLTFNVTTDNAAAFAVGPAIDTVTGDLTYTLADNWNGGPITVTVNLSDNGGVDDGGVNVSADQTFTISGTTVNDVPSFTVGADQTVLEDAGAKIVSGFASNISRGLSNSDAADDESGQTLTFNVTTDNSAAFAVGPAIDTVTGNLTYTLADNWNGGPITVTVNLSDNGGIDDGGVNVSADQTFTISSTAVNDVPSFTVGADQTVLEDAGAQTVLGFASNISRGLSNPDAADDESGQTLTFNVTTDNNAAFAVGPAIDTVTGNLTYTLADNWNGGPITVTVNLSDNGGVDDGGVNISADQTFTISGTTVNDVPSFTVGADQTVLEDAGAQTVLGFANNISRGLSNSDAADDESGQTLTFNVTTDNSAAFAVGPAIDTVTGNLTYTLAANWNGGPITVTVNLSDNGGTDNDGVNVSADQTFTISSIAVNDVPSFTVGADQTVLEDAGAQTVLGFASNISRGLSNPDAADDESGQTLTFNVTTDNNAAFAVGPAIDTVTGNLTYTLAANWNGGPITITVNLSDNGGTDNGGVNVSADQTFTISSTAVNDAPIFDGNAELADHDALTTTPEGQTVNELFDHLFNDVFDHPSNAGGNDFAGIVITDNNANSETEGAWEYSTDSGATWFEVGVVSETNALVLQHDESVRLRFLAVYGFNSEAGGPGHLEIHAVDNSDPSQPWTAGENRVDDYNILTDDHRDHVSIAAVNLETTVSGKIHIIESELSDDSDSDTGTSSVAAETFDVPLEQLTGTSSDNSDASDLVTLHNGGESSESSFYANSHDEVNEQYGSELMTGSSETQRVEIRHDRVIHAEDWMDTVLDWDDNQEEEEGDLVPSTISENSSENGPDVVLPEQSVAADRVEQLEETDGVLADNTLLLDEAAPSVGLSQQLEEESEEEVKAVNQLVDALDDMNEEWKAKNRRS